MRSLRRSPGFTLTAIAVLSLGIGVNVAEIHMFDAVLHRLRVRDVDSVVRIYRIDGMAGFSTPAIEFYARHTMALAAILSETDIPHVFDSGDSDEVRCAVVSGNYFGELGVTPMYGRMLDEQDDRPGAAPVVVLSYTYWQARFGGDPGAVLKTIRLNGKPVQIAGIAPPDFTGVVRQPTYLWMPLAQYSYLTSDQRGLNDYQIERSAMLARLKPGVTLKAATEQFRPLTAEWGRQHPQYVGAKEWLEVKPAEAQNYKPEAIAVFATCILMVLLVLLSACANLGNMLLARGLARQREIEIRLAIGAGRWRLIRQLMTENLLLAALASAAALLVGKAAARLMLRVIAAPSNIRIDTDWRVVTACAAFGLIATLAFGLAPAFQAVSRGPRASRTRKVLISVQVAVSCVLLILSSFFARAIRHNLRLDVAFDVSGMTVVDPAFYLHRYKPPQARQAAADIAARIRQVPGVDGVSLTMDPPFRRSWIDHVSSQQIYLNPVDPAYFTTLRLPVSHGRIFGPGDPDALVVSESAARRLWPHESPLGKTCLIAKRLRTVTGVVKDSGANLLAFPDSVEAYIPIGDAEAPFVTLLVHASDPGARLTPALRAAGTVDGTAPIVASLRSSIDRQMDSAGKVLAIVGSLGAIATVLALLGIFGLVAFTVAQRTREIGVRMALGARAIDVLRVVLGQYFLPVAIGAACGLAAAAGIAKVVRNIIFGFVRIELISFGAGLLVFVAVAFLASLAPVRRALRIDPSAALRYE
ncbi:MAG TPA: FtsX-like permease family protein [Bryobacteraceae bacterium]